jgi:OPA family glycerol-3-phosphate transporter-like MFS transporter
MVAAAKASAVFPALGAVSVILTGWLSDRLGAQSRAGLLALGLLLAAAAMLGLMSLQSGMPGWLPVFAIGVTAFCLLGPYSYLGGAFALDFGGKQGAALSSGIIDGTGYLGSVLAGDTVARLSVEFGWKGVFLLLAAVSVISALGALWLFRRDSRAAAI